MYEGDFYCKMFSQLPQKSAFKLNKHIKSLIISSNSCNAVNMDELDLSKYPSLEHVFIGDNSYSYVSNITISDNDNLQSIEIGKNSFTQFKNGFGMDKNKYLSIRNCTLLQKLVIGQYSFSDFASFSVSSITPILSL